jgi:hypothetical protein
MAVNPENKIIFLCKLQTAKDYRLLGYSAVTLVEADGLF